VLRAKFAHGPEPSSIVLLCLDLGGLALADQRRKQGRSDEQWYKRKQGNGHVHAVDSHDLSR
jgi:hypothetical protein